MTEIFGKAAFSAAERCVYNKRGAGGKGQNVAFGNFVQFVDIAVAYRRGDAIIAHRRETFSAGKAGSYRREDSVGEG